MHYVTVLHYILLALDAQLAGFLYAAFASESHVVVIFYDFGAYESLFKVGVYDSCAVPRLHNEPWNRA